MLIDINGTADYLGVSVHHARRLSVAEFRGFRAGSGVLRWDCRAFLLWVRARRFAAEQNGRI